MKLKNVLIDRGKMDRERNIINLNTLLMLEDEELPVYINPENVDKEPVGVVRLFRKEGFVYGDFDLPSKKEYLKMFPCLALSIQKPDTTSVYHGNIRTINEALPIGVVLVRSNSFQDPKIPTLGHNNKI